MTAKTRTRRRFAWVGFSLIAAAGVAFAALEAGDLAYLVSPFALVPLGYLVFIQFEDSWLQASRRARVTVWAAAAALALAGAAWNVIAPSARSYVVGGLMALPVLVVTPLLDRGAQDGNGGPMDLGSGEPFGPP